MTWRTQQPATRVFVGTEDMGQLGSGLLGSGLNGMTFKGKARVTFTQVNNDGSPMKDAIQKIYASGETFEGM